MTTSSKSHNYLEINVLIIGSTQLEVLQEGGGQLRRRKVKKIAADD